ADPAKTHVTGTMKFDTAPQSTHIAGADELAQAMGITHPLWVCGSTGPDEEPIILQAYRTLLNEFPALRLAIIPRKPERFDEVAEQITQAGFTCVRRSAGAPADPITGQPVLLGDTMGELRKFYAHADVVFVGRTLVDLGEKQHGSDMIEPAALAKPTVVGPFTGNFTEVMNALRAADAIVEIDAPGKLADAIAALLRDPGQIGARARGVVEQQRGATERTMHTLLPLLSPTNANEPA
ncbi:MAG: 3-deoxy-D-manno-octulosonic acid transferase, partial [Tepidisphaeraceae bacterium]